MVVIDAHPSHVIRKRPSHRINNKNKFTLRKEIRDWINEQSSRHWFLVDDPDILRIHFCCKEDAMMYKLAWQGMAYE